MGTSTYGFTYGELNIYATNARMVVHECYFWVCGVDILILKGQRPLFILPTKYASLNNWKNWGTLVVNAF